jgi:hypothetical protein
MEPKAPEMTAGNSGERRLTAEYVAARVLLDATSIEKAATRILQAICESLGWEHGALWMVDRESDCLRCAQSWDVSATRFPEFCAISRATTFSRGVGLPVGCGRALRQRGSRTLWLTAISREPHRRAGRTPRRLRISDIASRRGPRLRDRQEDILALSDAFLVEIGRGLGSPPAGISRDARLPATCRRWSAP